jgi:hypothetical protein
MIESLRRAGEGGRVWVLCLSDEAYEALRRREPPGVELVRLSDFERLNPRLVAVRDQRSTMEYFFTMTPLFVTHVMRHSPGADWVTYLDADLWFFGSPQPIYDELGSSSVGIVPHRFPPSQSWRLRYGTFNVGWVSFRLDDAGVACAEWWSVRCLEWCRDTPDKGRFADQGYLDGFSDAVGGVRVIEHAGADLAPWNLRSHDTVWATPPVVTVDGQPLIFFHFHGLDRDARRYYFKHATYSARTTRVVRDGIYLPYVVALGRVQSELNPSVPAREDVVRRGFGGSPLGWGRRMALRGLSRIRGDWVRIPS